MINIPKSCVGIGFDIHRFVSTTSSNSFFSIKICGVSVEHDMRIEAHSDGDVGIHAVVDAIFGAVGLGDIGQHFPSTDQQWRNKDSSHFLEFAVKQAKLKGYYVSNADIIIICERPKISEYKGSMRERMSRILQIKSNFVNIKATTTEKLNDIGSNKGIAAYAIVQMQRLNWLYYFFKYWSQLLAK